MLLRTRVIRPPTLETKDLLVTKASDDLNPVLIIFFSVDIMLSINIKPVLIILFPVY